MVRTLGDARLLLDGTEIARLTRRGVRGRAQAKLPVALVAQREVRLEIEVRNAYGPGLLAARRGRVIAAGDPGG